VEAAMMRRSKTSRVWQVKFWRLLGDVLREEHRERRP
jgi:hypothetical protein